jgi:hypothetical protein
MLINSGPRMDVGNLAKYQSNVKIALVLRYEKIFSKSQYVSTYWLLENSINT